MKLGINCEIINGKCQVKSSIDLFCILTFVSWKVIHLGVDQITNLLYSLVITCLIDVMIRSSGNFPFYINQFMPYYMNSKKFIM